MSEKSWRDDVVIRKQVSVLGIVVAALVSGSLVFLIIVCMVPGQGRSDEGLSVLTTIALGVAAACILMRLIVPGVVVSTARRNILRGQYNPGMRTAGAQREQLDAFFRRTGDAGRLMIVYMVTTVLAAAILEWAIFLLLIVYLIDHQAVTLTVAIAILVALAAHVPWRARVFAWIDGQLRRLEEQRRFGPPRD
jgi:hypothetical protein